MPTYVDVQPLNELQAPAGSAVPKGLFAPGDKKPAATLGADRVVLARPVEFDFNTAALTEPAKRLLDQVAYLLATRQGNKVRVEGHTDNVGDPRLNLRLSQARARAVANYLSARGISAERLAPAGFGSERPLANNAKEVGRKKNRRVEFFFAP